jgi:hypothetical protein
MMVEIPGLRVTSPGNGSFGSWQATAKRRKDQRTIVKWALAYHKRPEGPPWRVVMTRQGRRQLDDDNLAGAFKSVRDEVAVWLGCGDSPRDPVVWEYHQELGPYGVRIEVTKKQEV